MEVIETFIKTLFKFLWRIFLILLWGCSMLAETILRALNNFLKDNIKK